MDSKSKCKAKFLNTSKKFGEHFYYDHRIRKYFLNMTQKSELMKKMIDQFIMKIKKFSMIKDPINKTYEEFLQLSK